MRVRWRRLWSKVRALRAQHGWRRTLVAIGATAAARVAGISILQCVHKPIDGSSTSRARVLTPRDLQDATREPALELPAWFVQATGSAATCVGVVEQGEVRSYAWFASDRAVPALQGLHVRMPGSAYVYKAFTDPRFRGRRLLQECTAGIEGAAAAGGAHELSAVIEVQNRSSRVAFHHAGFRPCGHVIVTRWPRYAMRFGCRCDAPCEWTSQKASRPAVTSGASRLKKDQIAERGARMARRDDGEYREYSTEEQRRQPGCPAREVVLLQAGHATSPTAWPTR